MQHGALGAFTPAEIWQLVHCIRPETIESPTILLIGFLIYE